MYGLCLAVFNYVCEDEKVKMSKFFMWFSCTFSIISSKINLWMRDKKRARKGYSMSELVDFSGTDTISIFSLQIIEPAIIFRDKSYGFSAAFFSETEDRATFSRQLVDLLNAKMGEDSPIMDLSRFLTSGKVAEKGREDALQRLVEVAAQYIDDNTKAQSSTKGIIAPPIGCVQAITPIAQSKTMANGSPNLLFARTVMFQTKPGEKETMRFVITANAQNQMDMVRMSHAFKKYENAIRQTVYNAMVLSESEEADNEMEQVITKATLGRAWYISEANVSCPLLLMDGIAQADPYIIEMLMNQQIKPAKW